MNPGIKFIALCIFISISFGNLFCQKSNIFNSGFIISNKGDTVNGYINCQYENKPVLSCLFKPTRSDNPTILGPNEIKGFGSYPNNNIFLKTTFFDGKSEALGFIRILFKGTYDLFYYELDGAKNFLIKEPDSTFYDIIYPSPMTIEELLSGMTSEKMFKQEIDSIFPPLNNKHVNSNDLQPKASSLVKYLRNYHNATGNSYIIYKGSQRDFYAAIVTGVTYDWYLAKVTNKEFQSSPELSPYAGIYLKLMNNKASGGILFQSSIAYKNHHYSYMTENPVSNDYYETFIKSLASISRIGVSVNLLQDTPFRPFVEGGGMVSLYFKSSYDNYRDQLLPFTNDAFSFHDQNGLASSLFYGAFLRAGIVKNMKNNNLLSFSGGYNFLTNSDANIHSIDFSIIYMMKLK
jgi:hypothetical protein